MNDETNLKDDFKIFRDRKPRTCPSCNGKNIAKIFWGYPADMEWYLKSIEEKKIVGGGCCTSQNDPKWKCTDCYTQIWRQN